MIRYNLRYRGPFEYDKLVLSIFQFSNLTKFLERDIQAGGIGVLGDRQEEIENLLKNLGGEHGLLSNILVMSMRMKK